MGTILILTNSSGGLYDFRNELLLGLLNKHRVIISLPDDTKGKELREEGCEIITTPINRRGVNPGDYLYDKTEYLRGICLSAAADSLYIHDYRIGRGI